MRGLRRSIVVVGKSPEPGLAKTRLCPPLTLKQAADLYSAFLHDSVQVARSVKWDRVSVIHPTRPGTRAALGSLLPADVRLVAQRGDGLQAALTDAFQRDLGDGFDQVVLVGSDNPTIRPGLLQRAAQELEVADVVIGPSEDGGYYLIAMSRPHAGLFERITWSTDVVFAETLERASELGLTASTVPTWYDVDNADGLRRLVAELQTLPDDVAPATRRSLARIAVADEPP